MNISPTSRLLRLHVIQALLAVSLAVVMSGCVSSPRARLNGAVYDGQDHGTYDYRPDDLNGLGFLWLNLDKLGNPTTPPIRFRYVWNTLSGPERHSVETNALLVRVATVWEFSAQTRGGHFTNHVSSGFLVFDDASTFQRDVSKRLLKEARAYFNDQTDGWDGGDGPAWDVWSGQQMWLECCTSDIVSVAMYQGTFPTHGGADPAILFNFVNDHGHAREFAESEMFIPNSGWEKRLSDICMDKVRKAEAVVNGTITHFEPKELLRFTVTPKTLHIYLCPGPDVGSGDTLVELPWSELREFLHPDGPARFFIAGPREVNSKQ